MPKLSNKVTIFHCKLMNKVINECQDLLEEIDVGLVLRILCKALEPNVINDLDYLKIILQSMTDIFDYIDENEDERFKESKDTYIETLKSMGIVDVLNKLALHINRGINKLATKLLDKHFQEEFDLKDIKADKPDFNF